MHYIIVFVDRYSDEDLLSVKFAGVAIGNPENCETVAGGYHTWQEGVVYSA